MAVPGEYGLSQGPQVTIRQIKKDSVDFVLSNVDLAYVLLANDLTNSGLPTRCDASSSLNYQQSVKQFPILFLMNSHWSGWDRSEHIGPDRWVSCTSVRNDTPGLTRHRRQTVILQGTLPLDVLLTSQDCTCEGACERCSVELTLNAKCTGDTTMDIYTRDLIRSGHGTIGAPVIAGICPLSRSLTFQTQKGKAF